MSMNFFYGFVNLKREIEVYEKNTHPVYLIDEIIEVIHNNPKIKYKTRMFYEDGEKVIYQCIHKRKQIQLLLDDMIAYTKSAIENECNITNENMLQLINFTRSIQSLLKRSFEIRQDYTPIIFVG